MAWQIADRIKETTTTTGTGAMTLAGAMTGFRAFAAVCAVGDKCYYALQAVDGSGNPTGAWETGVGTYSATNTLTRTTILASSAAGAAISLTGTTQVWGDVPASTLAPLVPGAGRPYFQSYVAAADALTNNAWAKIAYDTNEFDSDACYSTSAYRFTPNKAGKYLVTVSCQVTFSGTSGTAAIAAIYKNGTLYKQAPGSIFSGGAGGTGDITAIVDMNGTTDYVEGFFYAVGTSPAVDNSVAARNNFCAHYIGP